MTVPPEILWTAADAARATGGEARGAWSASGVSIDTRTLATGDLFTAIVGPHHDGHAFVTDALRRGAAAAMVSRHQADVPEDAPLLTVADTFQGLCDLARAARDRTRATITAVTGSVGKTGTKELLALALGASGRAVATAGNLNNHFGLPLSLARLPADADHGVFEMGMNHAGEIAPLSELTRPHVALITAIEPVHIENFESLDGIADAKAEIFAGLEPGGTAVINRDSPYFQHLADKATAAGAKTVLGFGVHSFSNARLAAYSPDETGAVVEASIGSEHLKYRLNVKGKHWALNSVGALAAAKAAGADIRDAAAALAAMTPPAGRGRPMRIALADGVLTVIDETYNASPPAMRAAFDVLAATKPGRGGRRVVVLGDMLELGDMAHDAHMGLADAIKAHDFDRVYACGPLTRPILDALPADMRGRAAADSDEIAGIVAAEVRGGDLVMVKGSAGSRMGVVVEALKKLGPAAADGGA